MASHQQLPITNFNWTPPDWSGMSDEEYLARVRFWAENVAMQFKLTDSEINRISAICRGSSMGFWGGLDQIRGIDSRKIAMGSR